jgi:galactan endo-1,6-beta-galactosidase
MWWALLNRNPSGSSAGNTDNLRPDMYRAHAAYMAAIAKHFADAGTPFATVEATNEPSGSWGASGTQEGCHCAPSTQASLQYFLRAELDARGLQSTPIAASDECLYDQVHGHAHRRLGAGGARQAARL